MTYLLPILLHALTRGMHILKILLTRIPLKQRNRIFGIITLQDQKAGRLIFSTLNVRSVGLDGLKELVEFSGMRIQFGNPQVLVFDRGFRGFFSLGESGSRCA